MFIKENCNLMRLICVRRLRRLRKLLQTYSGRWGTARTHLTPMTQFIQMETEKLAQSEQLSLSDVERKQKVMMFSSSFSRKWMKRKVSLASRVGWSLLRSTGGERGLPSSFWNFFALICLNIRAELKSELAHAASRPKLVLSGMFLMILRKWLMNW